MNINARLRAASISNEELVLLRKKRDNTEKKNDSNIYKCTELQKEFWHHWRIYPNEIANNIAGYIKATNFTKALLLEKTFIHLLKKHAVLRSKFIYKDDEICAEIESEPNPDFKIIDMSGKTEKEIIDAMICEARVPFNLEEGRLIRFRAIKAGEDTWYLLMIQHHIVSDGLSSGIIVKDMLMNIDKESFFKGESANFYEKYLENSVDLARRNMETKYWDEKMKDSDLTLHLPVSQLTKHSNTLNGERIEFYVPKDLKKKIETIAVDCSSTPFSVYMSALRILLYKYAKQEDAVIVIPVQGRDYPGSDSMVGCFLSMLPIRNSISKDSEIRSIIKKEGNTIIEAIDNKDVSFGTILKNMNVRSDSAQSSVYHIVFSYESDAMKGIDDDRYSFHELFLGTTKSDLTLELNQDGDRMHGWFEYRSDIYSEMQINLFIKSFLKVLDEMSYCQKVIDINTVSEDDLVMVKKLGEGRKIERDYETIPERFLKIAYLYPDRIALKDKEMELSFSELATQSYSFALKIQEKGIRAGDIVAIMMERTADFVIAVFAVLMAGGAYLPIEPSYPEKRVKFMLDDSEAKAIVLNPIDNYDYSFEDTEVIPYETSNDYMLNDVRCPEVAPEELAYIIYTSGTTGNPKGVMLEHKGLLNLSDYFKEVYGMSCEDRVLQFAHVIFDAFSWEIAISILNGGSLHIVEQNIILDSKSMAAFLKNNNITALAFPPQYWKQICNEDFRLRMLLTAGAEADEEVLKQADKADIYVNGYGPTENTVCISTWARKPGETLPYRIPIGKPMSNSTVYIMNDGKICGVNMIGEICVSGSGVARGYLNNPELNAEKFVTDPYTNERMYRTGDYGYWLDSGELAFVGRIDNQVKIRGYRIETAEVEKCIISMDGVNSCAVKAIKDDSNSNVLVAYVVSNRKMSATELNEWLNERLPFYMIPSIYYQLDEMPVTINGKIDYRKLDGQGTVLSSEKKYVAPETEEEKILCEIWENILGRKGIGIDDPFFESGGDSLLIIKIIEQAREKDLSIEIASFYEDKTIRKIAAKSTHYEEQEELDEINDVNEQDLQMIMNDFDF